MTPEEILLMRKLSERKRIDAGIDDQLVAIAEHEAEIERLKQSIEISKQKLAELDNEINELKKKLNK